MEKFIFAIQGEFQKIMFNDLNNLEEVVLVDKRYHINNKLFKILNLVHTSIKVQRYINLPLKRIWSSYDIILKLIENSDDTFYLVFNDASIEYYDINFFEKVKQYPNVKIVLIFLNPQTRPSVMYARNIMNNIKFDKIFTFDNEDAERYGFLHTINIYSKIPLEQPKLKKTDVFFIGRAKNRLSIINDIAKLFLEANVKFDFRITDVKSKDKLKNTTIVYNKSIPYIEVLKKVQECNCLLEIVQENQSGITFRSYEAICYNKRLITNNKNVKMLKYYNPKYINIIESTDDIKFDEIKDDKINYNYKNDYSPIYLLKQILKE